MTTPPTRATVRQLILELADLEDALRREGVSSRPLWGRPTSEHVTLVRRQANIIRELRRRRGRHQDAQRPFSTWQHPVWPDAAD